MRAGYCAPTHFLAGRATEICAGRDRRSVTARALRAGRHTAARTVGVA